jgi:hypothetical protein
MSVFPSRIRIGAPVLGPPIGPQVGIALDRPALRIAERERTSRIETPSRRRPVLAPGPSRGSGRSLDGRRNPMRRCRPRCVARARLASTHRLAMQRPGGFVTARLAREGGWRVMVTDQLLKSFPAHKLSAANKGFLSLGGAIRLVFGSINSGLFVRVTHPSCGRTSAPQHWL